VSLPVHSTGFWFWCLGVVFFNAEADDVCSGAEDSRFLSFSFTINFCERLGLWFSKYKNSFKNNENLYNSNLLIQSFFLFKEQHASLLA